MRRVLLTLTILLVTLTAFLVIVAAVQARQVHWQRAGASIFGGECGAGNIGYHGDDLSAHPNSFAELGMGSALGGLPYKARVRVLDPVTHRRATIHKLDIGGGGNNVEGLPRQFDLYSAFAKWFANADCNWTGVILWRRV